MSTPVSSPINPKISPENDENRVDDDYLYKPSLSQEFPQLPHPGSFMTLLEQIEEINKKKELYSTIPLGPKNNVFFLLGNSRNKDKKQQNKNQCFPDDCGVWNSDKGSTVNSYFSRENDEFKCIYLRNGQFCSKARAKGTYNWFPLSPQPTNVYKVHRYYATLKRDDSYKKRVTCIEGHTMADVIVVEYCGVNNTPAKPHGNSQKAIPYQRTDPRVLEKAYIESKSKPPREVYHDMLLNNSFEAPNDFQQIRSKKYHEKHKDGERTYKNVAEEILVVINMLQNDPNIQEIIHMKNKAPCIILYSNDQIIDMRTNISKGSVMGVDRTFNLGSCFVTSTVYKNEAVIHKESNLSPIFLGPMLLHWDADFKSFHAFFSHLQRELAENIDCVEIKIGSDQEKALIKALKLCFPSSIFMLCTNHIKTNIRRYLADKVGCNTKDRNYIIDCLFGENGIAMKDEYTFAARNLELNDMLEKYPLFSKYYETQRSKIYDYICLPRQKLDDDKVCGLWTNNNCESMNNILKLSIDWKPQKLPDLVNKVTRVAQLQMLDLRRSLYGTGNYILKRKYKRYMVDRSSWMAKNDNEKAKLFQNFLYRKKSLQKDKIVARNGGYSVPFKTKGIAKKPGQRKRGKGERTQKRPSFIN